MLRHSILPNQHTLASLLKTCAFLKTLSFGHQLHSVSLKLGLSHLPFVGSSLINFYSKCRLPFECFQVFDEIPRKDEYCYSGAIVGLAQNGRSFDALRVFGCMRNVGVGSTAYSVSGALRAAAEMAALEQCRVIHGHAVVTGFYSDFVVGAALVDGYGRAGIVSEARQVFDELLPVLNVVAWNAMMSGYAQMGDTDSVVDLFHGMKYRGLVPDEFSFLAVLTAFSNAGSVLGADTWLSLMKVEFRVDPRITHYTCLVGAKARAGQLEDAEGIAMTMPFEPDEAVWRILLSACAKQGATDMALRMGHKLLEKNPRDDSAFVILANVYASAGKWEVVAKVRKMMRERGVRKEIGQSWIEVRGEVHVFIAGDKRHELTMEIYAKLVELVVEIENLGYSAVPEAMLHEVDVVEKTESLWYHSEKLAVAFGVVSGAAPPGKVLRIVKNLIICRDCHEAFKYMCRVIDRVIVVRDVNRYHRFERGHCTCGDHW
ncbi:hypothetical protein GIB67_024688 [Kingdonia uniflora]|uniref:DYW domain-containing protein n=1 Tax=Kingdonia uniflora TaxID=39325 RepID=A0A7J7LP65_9MAGN|nr:hypothetical protein GIB67_024688 [Kingdonia uniflora]